MRKEPSGLTFYVDNREGVTRPSEGLSLRNFSGSLDQRLGSFFCCFGCLFTPFCCSIFFLISGFTCSSFRVFVKACMCFLVYVFLRCLKYFGGSFGVLDFGERRGK